jgi:hypothetical protein
MAAIDKFRDYSIPLQFDRTAIIRIPNDLTRHDLTQIIKWLKLAKILLVETEKLKCAL